MLLRLRKRVVFASLCTGPILFVALAATAAERQEAYSFQVDVHEVRLAFVATDQHNQDVPTLTPADIAVVDNGTVIRHFRSLSRYPQVYLEALVLIDASQFLAQRVSQEIAEAAQIDCRGAVGSGRRAVGHVIRRPGAEYVCVRECRDLTPATWVSKIRARGQTPLYDAMALGVEFLSKNRGPNYRPVLIILSDGDDTISKHSLSDAVAAAMRAEIPIYTLNTGDPQERCKRRRCLAGNGGTHGWAQFHSCSRRSVRLGLRGGGLAKHLRAHL